MTDVSGYILAFNCSPIFWVSIVLAFKKYPSVLLLESQERECESLSSDTEAQFIYCTNYFQITFEIEQ